MDRFDISAALRKRGVRQVDIATGLDVSLTSVNRVVHGRLISRKIAGYIADVLETDVDSLWPGRYKDGTEEARLVS